MMRSVYFLMTGLEDGNTVGQREGQEDHKALEKSLTSQELFSRLRLIPEAAQHRARNGDRSRLLDTPHGHAKMPDTREAGSKTERQQDSL